MDQLEAVHRLAVAVQESESEEAFQEATLDVVEAVFGVERAALLLYDTDGAMRFGAWRGLSDRYRAAAEGHSPWSPEDADAQPIVVPDALADDGLKLLLPVLEEEGIRALVFVPLVHRRRVIGTIMLYYGQPHEGSPTELRLAELVAAHVVLAMERRQGQAALRESEQAERAARWKAEAAAARLARLQRVTAELSRAVTVEEVARVVGAILVPEIGASTASLCLLDGEDLEIAYAIGYPDEVMDHWRRFPLDAPLPASDAVRSGQAVFLSSPDERDRRYPAMAGAPLVDRSAAFAMIPLASDEPIGCLVLGFPDSRPFDDQDEAFYFVLAARFTAALERARLFDEQRKQQARTAVLADAAAMLAASFDLDQNLTAVAARVVPDLADGCTIHLYGEATLQPRLVAAHHRDPDRRAVLEAIGTRYPPRLHSPRHAPTGIRREPVTLLPTVDDDVVARVATTADHRELLGRARLGSAMVIALMTRGRAVGALTLTNDEGRRLAPDTVSTAGELAGRLAVAIENSRLFRERSAIARTLQASLLPPDLPAIPGLDLATRYVAAGAGIDVGGDFYDVFPLDEDRHLVILGDICGRGVQAATVAALVRHSLRSAAISHPDPAAMLAHANQVLLRSQPADLDEPRFCTALVGVLTRMTDGTLVLDLAVGGHPRPLLRRANGAVEPIGSLGVVLGVTEDATATTTRLTLAGGDTIVAVTDGILEARCGAEEFGEEGLARVLASAGQVPAATMAQAIESAARAFTPGPMVDDLAVLVLRVDR